MEGVVKGKVANRKGHPLALGPQRKRVSIHSRYYRPSFMAQLGIQFSYLFFSWVKLKQTNKQKHRQIDVSSVFM